MAQKGETDAICFNSFSISPFQRRLSAFYDLLLRGCSLFEKKKSLGNYSLYFQLMASEEIFLLKTKVIIASSVLWNEFWPRRMSKTTLVWQSSEESYVSRLERGAGRSHLFVLHGKLEICWGKMQGTFLWMLYLLASCHENGLKCTIGQNRAVKVFNVK